MDTEGVNEVVNLYEDCDELTICVWNVRKLKPREALQALNLIKCGSKLKTSGHLG